MFQSHQQTNTQIFTGWMHFLLPNHQCESTEGLLVICLVCGTETGNL